MKTKFPFQLVRGDTIEFAGAVRVVDSVDTGRRSGIKFNKVRFTDGQYAEISYRQEITIIKEGREQ